MSSHLPEFVDPRRLASQGAQFSGTVELQKLSRLSGALKETAGEASFTLEFYQDERKRARIKGRVQAELMLECQRCLGAMDFPVDTELDLAVIEVPEEAERLPETIDPVWVEDDTVKLLDLVEDELVLAIPQIPRHESGACAIDGEIPIVEQDSDEIEKEGESGKPNPFAVLAGIKSDKQS